MGSLALDTEDTEKEIHVLVTGFGAFGDNNVNPSFLIASSLPTKYILPNRTSVKIHVHPEPIIVAYSHVRDLIPKLLFSKKDSEQQLIPQERDNELHDHTEMSTNPLQETLNYDIILNIGMAPGRHFYTLETQAHRDGYTKKDVEGATLENDTFWKETYACPEILHTSFDVADVWRRWKSALLSIDNEEDVRPSTDAGHYLCDFTYYASMLEYWRRDPRRVRPCVFLHVPGGFEEDDVRRGREVGLGVIAACVGSRRKEQELELQGVVRRSEGNMPVS